jgi:hypothetical protein
MIFAKFSFRNTQIKPMRGKLNLEISDMQSSPLGVVQDNLSCEHILQWFTELLGWP